MLPVVVNGIDGDCPAPIIVQWLAGIGIYIEAWKIIAGDIHTNAVTLRKY